MKKPSISVFLFAAAFAVTYLAICYAPGWRIKLEADPATYFRESITHMVFVKSLIALAAGAIAGAVPTIIRKITKR